MTRFSQIMNKLLKNNLNRVADKNSTWITERVSQI